MHIIPRRHCSFWMYFANIRWCVFVFLLFFCSRVILLKKQKVPPFFSLKFLSEYKLVSSAFIYSSAWFRAFFLSWFSVLKSSGRLGGYEGCSLKWTLSGCRMEPGLFAAGHGSVEAIIAVSSLHIHLWSHFMIPCCLASVIVVFRTGVTINSRLFLMMI